VGCGASRSLTDSICARGMLRARLMDVVGAIGEPKPAEAQSRERSCPGPSRQILNESGGDASTSSQGFVNYGPFTTTGDSFVVTMDASSSQPAGAAVAVSQVGTAPSPEVIRRQAFRVPGTTSLLIQNGPGDYVVSVGFASSDYTVTVEECTGGRVGGTSGTASSTASASAPSNSSVAASQTKPASAPPTGSTLDRKPNTTLFDAGGPETGPLPLMPDGGCPRVTNA
jgi:hypothetical protein